MEKGSLKQRTAKGIFWSALNNGSMQVLNALIGICLARLLTTADYGLVGMIAVFTAVAGAIQESGFTAAIANLSNPQHKDYNAVFWFSSLACLCSYTLLYILAPHIAAFFRQPELTDLSRFTFISLFFSGTGIAHNAYAFKNMIVKEMTILRIAALFTSGIVGIALALNGYAYWSLAWQQVCYIALTNVGRFFIIPWRPSLHIDFSPLKQMFSFSYKVLITSIVTTLNTNILTFIFGRLYHVNIVGIFSQAFKWDMMASSFVSGTIMQVAQPILVEVKDEKARQVNVFRKMLRFTSFIAFPSMFCLAMVAHEFVVVLATEKWADSAPLLRILCLSGAFLPFYTLYQNLMISLGKSNIYLWCTLSLIITQVTAILLLHSFGMTVIISVYTLISILWLLVWHFFAWKAIGLTLYMACKDLFPYISIAALVMVGVYFTTLSIQNLMFLLLLRVALAGLFYIGIMHLSGSQMLKECIGYFRKKKAK